MLRVGKIWLTSEETDVVRTSTLAVTTEVLIAGGAGVADGWTDPNVTDVTGDAALSVIQLMTVAGAAHSRFFWASG